MNRTYSLYEAKARLSQIIRAVREHGQTVIVSYHGEPVAEIRPIQRLEDPLAQRIAELEAHGVLVPAAAPGAALPPALARKRGALQRFLEERDS